VNCVGSLSSPSSVSEPTGEYGGGLSSSSSSTSIDLYHRAADGAPSIHCKVRISTSRSFLPGRFHDIAARTRLALRLWEPGVVPACLPSSEDCFTGTAPRKRGSDGRNKGSICRESSNSPKASGEDGGSQTDFSIARSNSKSTLCCALISSGLGEGGILMLSTKLALPFNGGDSSSRSRSRSLIYKR
jgi:hypothetical protein